MDRLKYTIRNPEHIIEELILVGMILDKNFLERIIPRLDVDYFQTPDVRLIIGWVLDYHDQHKTAPGDDIVSICHVEARHDKDVKAQRIEEYLISLLSHHSGAFNIEYVLNKAVEYFKKRSLTISMEDTKHFLDKDNLEEAELAYYKYKEVAQEIKRTPDPLGEVALQEWWDHTDEELMRFPGYLGKYLSPICRGQLIGVMGPPKRGKTTVLTEFAVIGLMHKLKVVYFNLEMDHKKMVQRIDTRLVGSPKITDEYKDFRLPVIDCAHNQAGKCRSPRRTNKFDLVGDDDKIREYDPGLDGKYQACSVCAGRKDEDFQFAPWYETRRYPKTPIGYFKKGLKDFHSIFGKGNFVLESHPIGTLSYKGLENRLTLLEQEDGFCADCIVVDYADNMKKEGKRDRRLEIGSIWEQLVALSQKRNCLVVTASQTNRAASLKADLSMEDLAEDYSKAMVADMFLAINQTTAEKDQQVLRIATVLHRHRGFSMHHQCRVLQAPEIGQFCLGSMPSFRKLRKSVDRLKL